MGNNPFTNHLHPNTKNLKPWRVEHRGKMFAGGRGSAATTTAGLNTSPLKCPVEPSVSANDDSASSCIAEAIEARLMQSIVHLRWPEATHFRNICLDMLSQIGSLKIT